MLLNCNNCYYVSLDGIISHHLKCMQTLYCCTDCKRAPLVIYYPSPQPSLLMYTIKRHCQQESHTLTSCKMKPKLPRIHSVLFLVLPCDKNHPAQEFPPWWPTHWRKKNCQGNKPVSKCLRLPDGVEGGSVALRAGIKMAHPDLPASWQSSWVTDRNQRSFAVKTFRTHSNQSSFYTQTNTIKPYGNQSGTTCGIKSNNYLSFIINSTSSVEEHSTQLFSLA